jgi:hypothetical protein
VIRCALGLTDLGAGGIRIGDPGGKGASIANNAVVSVFGPVQHGLQRG